MSYLVSYYLLEDFDYVAYFIALCDEPSSSNVSFVWLLEYDHEVLVGGQVLAAFLLLFLLIGMPLNLTVIAIILKKRLYRRPSFVLMFNLMLSDLVYIATGTAVQLSTAITGEFWSVLENDRAKCAACQFGGLSSGAFLLISLLTVTFMSFDRFLFLHKPLKYSQILTSVRVAVVLVVMWIVNIIVAVLPLVGFGHVVFYPLFLACIL